MNRRLKFLPWLLSAALLFTLAVASSSPPLHDAKNTSSSVMNDFNMTSGLHGRELAIGFKKELLVSVSRKGGKGKGAYGGANVVRKPHHNSAGLAFAGPRLILGSLVFILSLGFILI